MILFHPQLEPAPPDALTDVVAGLSAQLPALAATATQTGGLRRERLRDVVAAALRGRVDPAAGLGDGFGASQLDYKISGVPVAVTVQTGRAWTNNEALLGVLAAACAPQIEWLVLLAPMKYKKSSQYPHILQQLKALTAAQGVDLDLKGVVLLAF